MNLESLKSEMGKLDKAVDAATEARAKFIGLVYDVLGEKQNHSRRGKHRMSEANRKAASERMKKYHAQKNAARKK